MLNKGHLIGLIKYLLLGLLIIMSFWVVEWVIDSVKVLNGNPKHPSDSTMLEFFEHNRAEFEMMRKMILADEGLVIVGKRNFKIEENSERPSLTRLRLYRKTMKNLGVRQIRAAPNRSRIYFEISSNGFVTHSSAKGYLHADKIREEILFPSLDEMTDSRRGVGYRHLDGDWYLIFEGY
jgi:hypothetical protein